MKIVCVDDEALILGLTVSLCRELPGDPDVVGFTKSVEALESVKSCSPDVVILDINMPDMDGITLASKVKEFSPYTAIIFLTGYSEYAVDAFGLHASGYLLKPVSRERLAAEVEYAVSKRPVIVNRGKESHIIVQTFGGFDIYVDGFLVTFRRSKAKELLAYLVDRQGSSVTRAGAFSVLWEDAMYDRSRQKQLDVVIRSLRQTLSDNGISEILEMKNGALRIVPETIDCDLYKFFDGDVGAINAYRGEYMSEYTWASFTEAYMDRKTLHIE